MSRLWTPADLATPPEMWLESWDESTLTIVDGKISEWRDKMGNHDWTQATAANRPTLTEAELNGRDVATFTAANATFLSTAAPLITTENFSYFSAFSRVAAGQHSFSLVTTTNNGLPYAPYWYSDNISYSGVSAATNVNHRAANTGTGWRIWSYTRNSLNQCQLWENGTSLGGVKTAGAIGTSSPGDRFSLFGRRGSTSTVYANGPRAIVIALNYEADTDTRQKIEGYIAYMLGLQGDLQSDHPYKTAPPMYDPPPLMAVLEQIYEIEPFVPVSSYLEQPYHIDTIQLQTVLSQRYGDVPWLTPVLLQPYGDAPWMTRSLEQLWGDAVDMEISLEQPWMMPGTMQCDLRQPYGIAAEILNTDLAQPYNLNPYDILTAELAQPYAIDGEESRLHSLDTKLYVDDWRFPYFQLDWQATDGEYYWSCAFSTRSRAAALRCVEGAAIRIEHMGETYHFKCYDGWMLDRRHGEDIYRIEGFSRTRDLDEALPITGEIAGGMASAIVSDIAADYDIEVLWEMADGYISAGKFVANGETPLAVIGNPVHQAEGILQSTPDGKLLIVAAEETPIPDYPTAPVAATIYARLERISTSEQSDRQPGYNFIEVSNQTAVSGQRALDYVEIDSRTRELRLFVTPLAGRSFALLHSGGPPVSIEPCGMVTLPIDDEQVEFIAGSARTSKPVYAVRDLEWLRDDLGGISWDEDGVLTSTTPDGYSLLKISYDSRYVKWICRSDDIADVQFRAVELATS